MTSAAFAAPSAPSLRGAIATLASTTGRPTWAEQLRAVTMAADADNEWISVDEAVELTGVDPATIWRAAKEGRIGRQTEGAGKRPRRWRYRRIDVVRWKDARAPKATPSLEDRVASLEAWREQMENGDDA